MLYPWSSGEMSMEELLEKYKGAYASNLEEPLPSPESSEGSEGTEDEEEEETEGDESDVSLGKVGYSWKRSLI